MKRKIKGAEGMILECRPRCWVGHTLKNIHTSELYTIIAVSRNLVQLECVRAASINLLMDYRNVRKHFEEPKG